MMLTILLVIRLYDMMIVFKFSIRFFSFSFFIYYFLLENALIVMVFTRLLGEIEEASEGRIFFFLVLFMMNDQQYNYIMCTEITFFCNIF